MSRKPLDLSKVIIKDFDPKKASKELWEKYHRFNEKNHRELFPDDSLPNRATVEKHLIIGWIGYHKYTWLAFTDSSEEEIAAYAELGMNKEGTPGYEENKHNSYFYIWINSDYWRRGLGTELLKRVAKKALEHGCRYLETDTYYESGKKFCLKNGAKIINESSENRLLLREIDWQMVGSWVEDGSKRAPNVTMESFYITPEEDIEEICALETELERQMPYLEEENKWIEISTPEKRRKGEERIKEMGYKRYTLITREENGKISGLTEIRFSLKDRPERIYQGLTGVKEEYRGRGLGKWLKAQMLFYIKENLPEAKYIVAGNADHNAPMLSINNRLGFKPYYEETSLKFALEELIASLK